MRTVGGVFCLDGWVHFRPIGVLLPDLFACHVFCMGTTITTLETKILVLLQHHLKV